MMLLGDGWAFVHIPKCGGTSVRSALNGREYGRILPMGLTKTPIMSPWHRVPPDKLSGEISIFTFIRNPVDWIVSFWCDQRPERGCRGYLHKFWDADVNGFAEKLCAAHPEGYISTLYSRYIRSLSGTRVYKLEEGIENAIYDATGIKANVPRKNASEEKPTLKSRVVDLILDCEKRVIKGHGY